MQKYQKTHFFIKQFNNVHNSSQSRFRRKRALIPHIQNKKNQYQSNDEIALLNHKLKAFIDYSGRLKNELNQFQSSRGYILLQKYYRFRDKLLPQGSVRKQLAKKIALKVLWFTKIVNRLVSKPTSIYSNDEIDRQNWCRRTPISTNIKFSIIVPAYQTPKKIFKAMLESVFAQIYTNWELCIIDASPSYKYIKKYVEKYSVKYPNKIKYQALHENLGISENTNQGFKMATGDYVALLDHDDLLAPNALYEFTLLLHKNPETDFLYSDSDLITENGFKRTNRLFKPDYSPEIMYSANYFTHFSVVRKTFVDEIPMNKKTDGSQDWDFFLKIMEKTNKIVHCDRVLYHWRISPTSVALNISAKTYALDAQILSLNDYIKRKNWNGHAYFPDKKDTIIKIDWNFKKNPTITYLVLSSKKQEVHIENACGNILYLNKNDKDINQKICEYKSDIFIFIDADDVEYIDGNQMSELTSWALHPDIGFVVPMLTDRDKIKSAGLVYRHNIIMDFFGDKPYPYYGETGSSLWYRNLSLFRNSCVAISREKWLKGNGYKAEYDSLGIAYNSFKLKQNYGYRTVYNGFAKVSVKESATNILKIQNDFEKIRKTLAIPYKDPYLNNFSYADTLTWMFVGDIDQMADKVVSQA